MASPRPLKKMMSSFVILTLAVLVRLLRQKFARGLKALGGRIGVGRVLAVRLDDDLLDPVGDLFALLDRVADVLPHDLDAELAELLGNGNDLADLVFQFIGAE